MSEPLVPNMNCASFILPYPEEIAKKTGASGMVFSIRKHYLLLARQADDTDPKEAAALREIASYYPDVNEGEIINRDSSGNIVADFDDWDELSDEQKIHRGNVNAAMDAVDRIRYELENADYDYDTIDDVTRVRRALAEISL
ncbi:hypothetical protein JOH50_001746 [Rhizobium leguminosarum]|uniref:hypothetical protein n=1 Tax=Rhizobium leguminosarum TaxID=384 RepID=UPI001AE4FE44|nr:hypothetical protein [Rhizobium leguminosarum]MBP2486019.1 hypothetical protein [Rhizobium leguminosarum]